MACFLCSLKQDTLHHCKGYQVSSATSDCHSDQPLFDAKINTAASIKREVEAAAMSHASQTCIKVASKSPSQRQGSSPLCVIRPEQNLCQTTAHTDQPQMSAIVQQGQDMLPVNEQLHCQHERHS